jgi:ribosomal protein S18 acetylase RimI-like enzyme
MIQYLEWDSQFFGHRIGRILQKTLTESSLAQIKRWAEENQIDCLYFLATPDDDMTVQLAEQDHFHLVDLRVTLRTSLEGMLPLPEPSIPLDYAQAADIPALKLIAGQNHTNSRFFTDTHFPRQKCRELYEIWIEKAVHGPDTKVFVWRAEGKACAYVTARLLDEGCGDIDLVGIDPRFQGRGLGPQLIIQALNYFRQQQVMRVQTATQGRNIHALKLYQKCGFSIDSIELWYHKWFIHHEKR